MKKGATSTYNLQSLIKWYTSLSLYVYNNSLGLDHLFREIFRFYWLHRDTEILFILASFSNWFLSSQNCTKNIFPTAILQGPFTSADTNKIGAPFGLAGWNIKAPGLV